MTSTQSKVAGTEVPLQSVGGMGQAHLAHHFETENQQFAASKFGMWLFLATEILLFGGLFVAYAVFRGLYPETFVYGSKFLDVRWGTVNTIVLLLSSFTMALAVSAAQQGKQRQLVWLLQGTFLGGLIFLGIKYVEYSHKFDENLVWGSSFYETPAWVEAENNLSAARLALEAPREEKVIELRPGDPVLGEDAWNGTCRSCHGARGEGVETLGRAIAGSEFLKTRTDDDLLAFLIAGRAANAPDNELKKEMPPRGGNPLLTDQDLMNVIALARTFPPPEGGEENPAGGGGTDSTLEKDTWVEKWVVPLPPSSPGGVILEEDALQSASVEASLWPHHSVDPKRPQKVHLYFGLYFVMTGLHGIHVLAGMGLIAWLIVRASKGHFGRRYYTPVDLGGLYWHLVDVIWIFLFPMMYLI